MLDISKFSNSFATLSLAVSLNKLGRCNLWAKEERRAYITIIYHGARVSWHNFKCISLDHECESQMDGEPNRKLSKKAKVELIECSLKNCKMAAYSQVNQTMVPVPNYCSVRHRCILVNVVLVRLRAAGFLRSAGQFQ